MNKLRILKEYKGFDSPRLQNIKSLVLIYFSAWPCGMPRGRGQNLRLLFDLGSGTG